MIHHKLLRSVYHPEIWVIHTTVGYKICPTLIKSRIDCVYSGRQWCGTATTKTLYNSQNLMTINVLHHGSQWKKNSEFRGIRTFLKWFLKLSHSAVAVLHHCRPLYMNNCLIYCKLVYV